MFDWGLTDADMSVWIDKNYNLFKSNPEQYTPDHVSQLALMGHFPAEMVYRRLAHFGEALILLPETHGQPPRKRWTFSEMFLRDLPPQFHSWEELGEKLIQGLEYRD